MSLGKKFSWQLRSKYFSRQGCLGTSRHPPHQTYSLLETIPLTFHDGLWTRDLRVEKNQFMYLMVFLVLMSLMVPLLKLRDLIYFFILFVLDPVLTCRVLHPYTVSDIKYK